ncbi:hypothetical protein [Sphingobium sp.]|uniref:hypothetical protein n=1 Tax=Sphingobium sp. TaxID=1912891 RepID=UPI0028BE5C89|nr:hypothetical protein [Sphingobium sp.]
MQDFLTKLNDARPGKSGRQRTHIEPASIADLIIHVSGFFLTIQLMSWGLVALFFLAIGGGTTHGMVIQLHNFTGHYLAADAEQRATFNLWVIAIYFGLVTVLALLRRHQMFPVWPGSARHG